MNSQIELDEEMYVSAMTSTFILLKRSYFKMILCFKLFSRQKQSSRNVKKSKKCQKKHTLFPFMQWKSLMAKTKNASTKSFSAVPSLEYSTF